MRFEESEKKQLRKILIAITYAVVLFFVIYNYKDVTAWLSYFFGLLSPFILGAAFGFLIHLLLKFFETKLFYRLKRNPKAARFVRPLAILCSILILVLIIQLFVLVVIPQVSASLITLVSSAPVAIASFKSWLTQVLAGTAIDTSFIDNINVDSSQAMGSLNDFLSKNVTNIFNFTSGVAYGIFSFILSVIFAIYVLLDDERLIRTFKKILYSFVSLERADRVISVTKYTITTFENFISGQLLMALITGGVTLAGMLLLRIPYAVLGSVIIGLTSLIPLFGAIIGTVIAAFFILIVDPIKAVWFVVFILLTQQIIGNIIFPRVVGNSIGLPALWVLVTISIGGSMFGVAGMILGIPFVSVFYALMREYISQRIALRQVPPDRIGDTL